MNDKQIDNSIIFFKIYRNKYLRFKILNYVRLYNQGRQEFKITDSKEFIGNENKEFLSNIYYNCNETIDLKECIKLETIRFGDNFQKLIYLLPKSFIPRSVKKLILSNSITINHRLNGVRWIPDSVTELNLGHGFYSSLSDGDIPSTIKKLTFGKTYKEPFTSTSFSGCTQLESIIFDYESHFNKPINVNDLPNTLVHFETGAMFKQNLNCLPTSLTSLIIGSLSKDNPPKLGYLINLKHLELKSGFNTNFYSNDLPCNLQSLQIGWTYENVKIPVNVLPQTLTSLSLHSYYFEFEIGTLPNSLLSLKLESAYIKRVPIGTLPKSITSLDFGSQSNYQHTFEIGSLPQSLTSFDFHDYGYPLEEGLLSNTITDLTLPHKFNQELTSLLLPNSLKKLTFHYKFDYLIKPNILPRTLETLIMSHIFNQPISIGVFPNSITKLYFGDHFNQVLNKDTLPSQLILLWLGELYNSVIESLPNTLQHLEITGPFNHKLQLPNSLKVLKLSKHYDQHIEFLPNIKVFTIGGSYQYQETDDQFSSLFNDDDDDY